MKRYLLLFVIACLIVSCSEAPFDPNMEYHPFAGWWVGSSSVTYSGSDDKPVTWSIGVVFVFSDEGLVAYDDSLPGIWKPFKAEYEIDRNRIVFHVLEQGIDLLPLQFEGSFRFTMANDKLRMTQKPDGEINTTWEIILIRQ